MTTKLLDFEKILAPCWTASPEECRHLMTLLEHLVDIREKCRRHHPVAPLPPSSEPSEESGTPLTHPLQRPPMRIPKPGSLRAVVRDVLRQAGQPLPRAEIIARAAASRGRPVDEVFRTKVGDVLAHPHDPCFRKISRGVYALNG